MKKKYGLLPYIREDIFGINQQQIIGWEIKKFDIQKQWIKSEGLGVKIAVIDTGCDIFHEDIKKNILEGFNAIHEGKDPIDKNGHGTHVCGTICANNNTTGMVGVAPKAKIVPVKALADDGNGSLESIIKAIIWSADYGVDFITMSLGSPYDSHHLHDAIKYASNKGCIIFCAAGNSGPSSDIMYPAKYKETISIGAIDENLDRTSFTCSGESLDFLAPGHNILSCVPNNRYALMSGTSMSNPFAVGCAALVCSYFKNNFGKKMNSQDYISFFRKTAIPLKDPAYSGQKRYEGYGIIKPVL
jgi:major intracellular serine protease